MNLRCPATTTTHTGYVVACLKKIGHHDADPEDPHWGTDESGRNVVEWSD